MRGADDDVYVMMLTARDSEAEVVAGARGGRRRLRDQAGRHRRAAQPRARRAAPPPRRRRRRARRAGRCATTGSRSTRRRGRSRVGDRPVDLTRSEFAVARGAAARRRRGPLARRSCCRRSTATTPTATRAASTSTSTTCARSSAAAGGDPGVARHGARRRATGIGAMTGLRGRMIAALVVTSLATLAAAALVFDPLLEQRLENDRLQELRGLVRTTRPVACAADARSTAGSTRLLDVVDAPRAPGGRADRRSTTRRAHARRHGARRPALRRLASATSAPSARRRWRSRAGSCRARAADSPTRRPSSAPSGDRLTLVIAKRLDDTRAAASVVRAALPRLARRRARGRGDPRGAAQPQPAAAVASPRGRGDAARGPRGCTTPSRSRGATRSPPSRRRWSRCAGVSPPSEAERVAFLATASHELRTPLASLQATLELLREETLHGDATPAGTLDRADTALRSTHRLVALASDLLELSRQDSHMAPAIEPVDVAEVAAAIARESGGRLAARGRTVAVAGAGERALADPGAVARIVAILLDNADRHGAGEIRVEVGRDDGGILLAVEDDGPGLEPGDRERAFARFERGRAAAGGSGAGLGLPIARGLARVDGRSPRRRRRRAPEPLRAAPARGPAGRPGAPNAVLNCAEPRAPTVLPCLFELPLRSPPPVSRSAAARPPRRGPDARRRASRPPGRAGPPPRSTPPARRRSTPRCCPSPTASTHRRPAAATC